MSAKLEYIDHDADAGVIVVADTLAELFRASALGMLDIVIDRKKVDSLTTRIIAVEAESTDLLLVKFLSEILAEIQVDNFAICDVEMGEIDENSAVAEISGQRNLPAGSIRTEIKLVTYHQLDVHRDADGKWHARVIFDL